MKTFKDLAYEILKEAGKPLHSREITRRALKLGLARLLLILTA
ncbi:HTH domain-containing protein [Hippea maritima]